MHQQRMIQIAAAVCVGIVTLSSANAVSPTAIQQGRALFERQWRATNPLLGSDGLGPLFNANSCVACHHQGGTGGGGDARFNAHSIGIEKIEFVEVRPNGSDADDRKRKLIHQFFPALVQPGGMILNSAPVPHHGGSPEFVLIRKRILKNMESNRSDQGGAIDAEGARWTANRSIYHDSRRTGRGSTYALIEARLFQRNTTALFGSGLIDTIGADDLRKLAKAQQRHPEISGRPSILPDGSLGRLGCGANAEHLIDFVEQACANELSLETEARSQSIDPGRPSYRNPGVDITNQQIQAMTVFVSSLPRPIRLQDSDSESLQRNRLGQQTFDSVGCAVCHVPDVGSVVGIYTDLLLHDMGPNLYDHDAAEPHVTRARLSSRIEEVPDTRVGTSYGAASTIASSGQQGLPDRFVSPRGSLAGKEFVALQSERLGRRVIATQGRRVISAELSKATGFERTVKASNTTQEWRTPPLWGVGDSAPYMHDGRAKTLLEAIAMHDGESAGTRDRFLSLPLADRRAVIAFLETLIAPPNAVPQS